MTAMELADAGMDQKQQQHHVWRIALSNLSASGNLLEATELANVLQEVASNIQVTGLCSSLSTRTSASTCGTPTKLSARQRISRAVPLHIGAGAVPWQQLVAVVSSDALQEPDSPRGSSDESASKQPQLLEVNTGGTVFFLFFRLNRQQQLQQQSLRQQQQQPSQQGWAPCSGLEGCNIDDDSSSNSPGIQLGSRHRCDPSQPPGAAPAAAAAAAAADPYASAREAVAVLKVGSSRLAMQAEQFANELTRHLGIAAPDCRVVRQVGATAEEWAAAFDAAGRLANGEGSHVPQQQQQPDHQQQQQSDQQQQQQQPEQQHQGQPCSPVRVKGPSRALGGDDMSAAAVLLLELSHLPCFLLMELVDGPRLSDCCWEALQGPGRALLLADVGRLFLLDMLLGNADRMPCGDLGWRGNSNNLLHGAAGTRHAGRPVAIDSCVARRPPALKASAEDAAVERLAQLLLAAPDVSRSLLVQLLGSIRCSSRSSGGSSPAQQQQQQHSPVPTAGGRCSRLSDASMSGQQQLRLAGAASDDLTEQVQLAGRQPVGSSIGAPDAGGSDGTARPADAGGSRGGSPAAAAAARGEAGLLQQGSEGRQSPLLLRFSDEDVAQFQAGLKACLAGVLQIKGLLEMVSITVSGWIAEFVEDVVRLNASSPSPGPGGTAAAGGAGGGSVLRSPRPSPRLSRSSNSNIAAGGGGGGGGAAAASYGGSVASGGGSVGGAGLFAAASSGGGAFGGSSSWQLTGPIAASGGGAPAAPAAAAGGAAGSDSFSSAGLPPLPSPAATAGGAAAAAAAAAGGAGAARGSIASPFRDPAAAASERADEAAAGSAGGGLHGAPATAPVDVPGAAAGRAGGGPGSLGGSDGGIRAGSPSKGSLLARRSASHLGFAGIKAAICGSGSSSTPPAAGRSPSASSTAAAGAASALPLSVSSLGAPGELASAVVAVLSPRATQQQAQALVGVFGGGSPAAAELWLGGGGAAAGSGSGSGSGSTSGKAKPSCARRMTWAEDGSSGSGSGCSSGCSSASGQQAGGGSPKLSPREPFLSDCRWSGQNQVHGSTTTNNNGPAAAASPTSRHLSFIAASSGTSGGSFTLAAAPSSSSSSPSLPQFTFSSAAAATATVAGSPTAGGGLQQPQPHSLHQRSSSSTLQALAGMRLDATLASISQEARHDGALAERLAHWRQVFRERGHELSAAIAAWQSRHQAAAVLSTGFLDGSHPIVDAYELGVRLQHMLRRLSALAAGSSVQVPLLVLPRLFLGNAVAADSHHLLQHLGVTHLVNAAKELHMLPPPPGFHVLHVALADEEEEDMARHFHQVSGWIDAALCGGGAVLVHCHEGKSRSVALLMAHLMISTGQTLAAAFAHMRSVRPAACPNAGFMAQLMQLDCQLHGSSSMAAAAAAGLLPRAKPEARVCGICGCGVGVSYASLLRHMKSKHNMPAAARDAAVVAGGVAK